MVIEHSMGEKHNVVFGKALKVSWATGTLSSPSICLMRHIWGGEDSVLLALLTLSPCPKTTLCSSPIKYDYPNTYYKWSFDGDSSGSETQN